MQQRADRIPKGLANGILAVLAPLTVATLFLGFGNGGWWLLLPAISVPLFVFVCKALGQSITTGNETTEALPYDHLD